MTKKHFVAVAKAFAATRPAQAGPALAAWTAAMLAVADSLRAFNGAYDYQRFVTACYA